MSRFMHPERCHSIAFRCSNYQGEISTPNYIRFPDYVQVSTSNTVQASISTTTTPS
ncbi:hypothetical protein M758_2G220900 [Ceratodon purpureus]|nr:hypothetical protein M758_2G220900 [Ceratodon purpureus]